MTALEPAPGLRRILVAMDGAQGARAALEAAADLAAALQAELIGVFVEDAELLAAADLSVTWSIPSHAAARARLDSAMMRRALRVSAGQASAALAAVAERRRLKWSFRVLSGALAAQVLAEAQTCDLLALGAAGSAMRRVHLEVASGLMAMQAPCSLFLMHPARRAGQPVTVLFEGSARALALARQLAEIDRRRLVVAAVGESEAAAAARRAEAAEWLAGRGLKGEVRAVVLDDPREAGEALAREHPGVLVIDRTAPLGGRIPVEALVGRLACSVFVLR